MFLGHEWTRIHSNDLSVAGFAAKYLGPVPDEKIGLRGGAPAIWCSELCAAQYQKHRIRPALAVEPRRDQNPLVVRNRDGPAIECLMVDAAARQAVIQSVRAAELAPTDVGGIECDVGVVKLHAEPAKCATMVPCRDYFRREGRISACTAERSIEIEADGPGNALVQGLREVGGEQFSRQFTDCLGVIFQFGVQCRREAAAHLPFP